MSSQTPDRKPNELVHSETVRHSEPHEGHEGTSYEGADARAGLVISSLALIGGTLVVVFFMTVGIQKFIQHRDPLGEPPSPLAPARVVPPAPQIQVQPWEDLPQLRAHEDQILNSSGKDAEGHYHIPINAAITAVVSQLKVQPNAPVGLITPGGEGRNFSGSVNDMPPQYHPPTIQGEVRKSAQ